MVKRLTALLVENLKGGPARFEIPDGNGLYLVVQPSGVKSWAVRYRFEGKPCKLTLGRMSLATARVEAAKAMLELEQGRDPGAAKKIAKEKAVAAREWAKAVAADTVEAMRPPPCPGRSSTAPAIGCCRQPATRRSSICCGHSARRRARSWPNSRASATSSSPAAGGH